MKNIIIQEFFPEDRVDDRNRLAPVFSEIWNATENQKYLSFTLKPFDRKTIRNWLENHKEIGGHFFCAVNEKGEIHGIAVVKANPIEGFEIYGIGVRPRFKRQGIGRKLIEQAVNRAITLDYKAVYTSVFADNSAMLRILLSLDFIPVGMDYHKRADGADVVHMEKRL